MLLFRVGFPIWPFCCLAVFAVLCFAICVLAGTFRCECDCKAWRVFQSKLANYEKAVYSKKLAWNLQRHTHSMKAAEDYLRNNCRIIHYSRPDSVLGDFQQFCKDILIKHHIAHDNLILIGIVNWVAPCAISAPELELHANMIAMIAGHSPKNIVAILNPQFCYKKGQLYLSELMISNLLSERALNFDHKWGLTFIQKVDARDTRPLLYDGRVVVPFGSSSSDYFWKDCSLLKGRTEPAAMLPSKSLQNIEETKETAVPS